MKWNQTDPRLSINKTWCLYILSCGVEGHYYTGITNNLDHRLHLHRTKRGSKYTISRWPHISFLFSVTCLDKGEALKLEHKVKRLTRTKKEEFMRMEGKTWQWLLSQGRGWSAVRKTHGRMVLVRRQRGMSTLTSLSSSSRANSKSLSSYSTKTFCSISRRFNRLVFLTGRSSRCTALMFFCMLPA